MRIEVLGTRELRFDDGSPVRAASALSSYDDGWLVLQDDATHGARVRGSSVTRVRLLPPVAGLDTFDEAAGTKHFKPDLEAACEVTVDGASAVLLLGSGSTAARTRAVLVVPDGPPVVGDLSPSYDAVAAVLGLRPGELNIEGACVVGEVLRCFHRGLPGRGRPGAAVDLSLRSVLDAIRDPAGPTPEVVATHPLDVRAVDGTPLAVTDALHLGDGLVIVSTVAEDASDAYADGPVTASALALLDGAVVCDVAALPTLAGRVAKVEGLALVERSATGLRLLATADLDDPAAASPLLELRVTW